LLTLNALSLQGPLNLVKLYFPRINIILPDLAAVTVSVPLDKNNKMTGEKVHRKETKKNLCFVVVNRIIHICSAPEEASMLANKNQLNPYRLT
jgi:hypothetical protein